MLKLISIVFDMQIHFYFLDYIVLHRLGLSQEVTILFKFMKTTE